MPIAGKESKGKPANFLDRTYEMLNTPEYSEYVSWNDAGDAVVVHKVNKFSTIVLPKFYNHSNYASFTRQLNMYDFKKTSSEPSCREYKHPLFQRGKPELVSKIKRKRRPRAHDDDAGSNAGKGAAGRGRAESVSSTNGQQSLTGVLEEMRSLHSRQKQVENSIVAVSAAQHRPADSLLTPLPTPPCLLQLGNHNRLLAKENEMLWQQLSESRSRQQRLGNKMQRLFYVMYEIYRAMVNSGRGPRLDGRTAAETLPLIMGLENSDDDGTAGTSTSSAASTGVPTASVATNGSNAAANARQLAHRTYASLFGSDVVLTPEQFHRALDVLPDVDAAAPPPPTGGVVVSEVAADAPTGPVSMPMLTATMAQALASTVAQSAALAAHNTDFGSSSTATTGVGFNAVPSLPTGLGGAGGSGLASAAAGPGAAPGAASGAATGAASGAASGAGSGAAPRRSSRRRAPRAAAALDGETPSRSSKKRRIELTAERDTTDDDLPAIDFDDLDVETLLKSKDPYSHVTAANSALASHNERLHDTITELEAKVKTEQDFDVDELLDPDILEGLTTPNPAAAAAAAAHLGNRRPELDAVAGEAGGAAVSGAGASTAEPDMVELPSELMIATPTGV